MAKKLLVKTPQTMDGTTPVFDENDKKVYKETLLETSAQAHFESINKSLPDGLKHKFEIVEVDANGKIVEQLKAKKILDNKA